MIGSRVNAVKAWGIEGDVVSLPIISLGTLLVSKVVRIEDMAAILIKMFWRCLYLLRNRLLWLTLNYKI
jgi:hypothetical protein